MTCGLQKNKVVLTKVFIFTFNLLIFSFIGLVKIFFKVWYALVSDAHRGLAPPRPNKGGYISFLKRTGLHISGVNKNLIVYSISPDSEMGCVWKIGSFLSVI